MTGQCCIAHGLTRPLWIVRKRSGLANTRKTVTHSTTPFALSTLTASILPALVLVLLPKCPLCLAAWLTVATGIGFSAAAAAWARASIVLLWGAALALLIWNRTFRRVRASPGRLH